MTDLSEPRSTVLVAARPETSFPLRSEGSLTVVRAETGAGALYAVRESSPAVIVLDYAFKDASGPEICRQLRADPHVGRGVPILFLVAGRPSPEQRVTALHCGAWEFIQLPADIAEMDLKIRLYAEAKRHFDLAVAAERLEGATGIHTSVDLARQAHQLGALMGRLHSGLACVVLEVTGGMPATGIAMAIARQARSSDVVGMLSHGRVGILAPATDREGAVKLAERVANEARRHLEQQPTVNGDGARLLVGFDAVTNVRYAPVDPVTLIRNASFAVRNGAVEPGNLWLRSADNERAHIAADPLISEAPLRSTR